MAEYMRAPELNRIHITDPLFGAYAALVADVIIPYQWDVLNNRADGAEKSYCIENFRIAAGELPGEHRGAVFCDTDAYKWLETVAYCISNGSGERFAETADGLIELIGRAQQPDGYLNTYFSVSHPSGRWKNLAEGHELYCAGHLIEAAVAYWQATGRDALLNIARRFADLICGVFGPEEGRLKGCPGHQEIELALVKLWRATGERRYLELSAFFIETRGTEPNYLLREIADRHGAGIFPALSDYDPMYSQTHMPPREQRTAEGHAVRALYMYSAMADLAQELGDSGLEEACRALWRNITQKRMYITGGVGSSGTLERFTVDYDLPNDRMYCETCASIGLMMFGQRMTSLCRDAEYCETVERALCNTVLAGISASGDRYFYVNPLEVWPDNCVGHSSMAHVKPERQPWFDVACCPTNVARTLASLGQYIYAEDRKSIYVCQFISSELRSRVQGNDILLTQDSRLMTEGTLTLRVRCDGARPFTIRLRLPSWLREPVFTLNGSVIAPAVENGFAVLAVSRAGVQTFTLSGSVGAAFAAADLRVRADSGRLAIVKGPFVYCLEQADNGEDLAAVRVGADAVISEEPPLAGLPGALPTLRLPGKRLTCSLARPGSLYGTPAFRLGETELRAVPYCLWGNRGKGEMRVWLDAQIQ